MTIMHIAGSDIRVGNQLRQRCAWCGATLLDYDLERIATVVDPTDPDRDPTPATWPVGALVETDGCVSYTVDHDDGEQLPRNCCGQLDHAVTK